jgi:hypothetical protein
MNRIIATGRMIESAMLKTRPGVRAPKQPSNLTAYPGEVNSRYILYRNGLKMMKRKRFHPLVLNKNENVFFMRFAQMKIRIKTNRVLIMKTRLLNYSRMY